MSVIMQPNPLIDVQDTWITNYSQFPTLLFSGIFGRFWIIACYFATIDDIVYLIWFLYSQHSYHSHTLPDQHSMQSQIKSYFGKFTEIEWETKPLRSEHSMISPFNAFNFVCMQMNLEQLPFSQTHTLSNSKISFYYCALRNPNGEHVRIIANIAT